MAGTAYATFVIAFQLVDDGGALRREGVPLRGTLISVAQSLALRLLLLEPLKFGLMALLPQRLFERAAHSRKSCLGLALCGLKCAAIEVFQTTALRRLRPSPHVRQGRRRLP